MPPNSPRNDDEFLAAGTGHGIDRAQAGSDLRSHLLQTQVAHRVAKGVVDLLKAIQVDTDDRGALAVARRLSKGLPHAIFQQQAIGQAG